MHYPNSIEDICYDKDHIDEVIVEIKNKIIGYFGACLTAVF